MIYGRACLMILLIFFSLDGVLSASIVMTKQMLEEKILQTRMYDSDLTVKFVPTKINSYDGEIIFHFSTNDKEQDEILAYQIKNGKIVFYGYDGSKHRMTLLSVKNNTWTILEEEDMDGDDKQFGFGKPEKQIYKVIQSRSTTSQKKYTEPTSSIKLYNNLYMQIYGRLDTLMASSREYLDKVDRFLDTTAHYLMDKYKFELKLHNIELEKNKNTDIFKKMRNNKKKFQSQVANIEKLDGKTIEDYDGNHYKTFNDLEKAFMRAGKKSIEIQRIIYQDEFEREKLMTKMKNILDRSGTKEQKQHITKMELTGQKYDYNYYKKLLDTDNFLLLPDRDASQKKPLFHPRRFMSVLLLKRLSLQYLNSRKKFETRALRERIKKIDAMSMELKHKFNRDYLYKLRMRVPMYPD